MTQVIIGWCVDEFAGFSVGVYWCKYEIPYVIGAAILIKQYVPIRPANSTIIEIINDGTAVTFCIGPKIKLASIKSSTQASVNNKLLEG